MFVGEGMDQDDVTQFAAAPYHLLRNEFREDWETLFGTSEGPPLRSHRQQTCLPMKHYCLLIE